MKTKILVISEHKQIVETHGVTLSSLNAKTALVCKPPEEQVAMCLFRFNITAGENVFKSTKMSQINKLSEIIQWFVVLEVNAENAMEMFRLGVLHNNHVIREAAFQQIEKNLKKKLPLDSVNEFLRHWKL